MARKVKIDMEKAATIPFTITVPKKNFVDMLKNDVQFTATEGELLNCIAKLNDAAENFANTKFQDLLAQINRISKDMDVPITQFEEGLLNRGEVKEFVRINISSLKSMYDAL